VVVGSLVAMKMVDLQESASVSVLVANDEVPRREQIKDSVDVHRVAREYGALEREWAIFHSPLLVRVAREISPQEARLHGHTGHILVEWRARVNCSNTRH
jgi:hypothetical protein